MSLKDKDSLEATNPPNMGWWFFKVWSPQLMNENEGRAWHNKNRTTEIQFCELQNLIEPLWASGPSFIKRK